MFPFQVSVSGSDRLRAKQIQDFCHSISERVYFGAPFHKMVQGQT